MTTDFCVNHTERVILSLILKKSLLNSKEYVILSNSLTIKIF